MSLRSNICGAVLLSLLLSSLDASPASAANQTGSGLDANGNVVFSVYPKTGGGSAGTVQFGTDGGVTAGGNVTGSKLVVSGAPPIDTSGALAIHSLSGIGACDPIRRLQKILMELSVAYRFPTSQMLAKRHYQPVPAAVS